MIPDIEKLKLPPAYLAVSQELQKLILSGALRPGDALPSETALAERFGVHRSTIREGIRQLESEGLLRRVARKRLLVSRPESDELASRSSRALLMHQVTFRQLWEAAMALEPLAARLAAERARPEHVAKLRENLAQTEAAIAAQASPVALDTEFHTLVCAATGNLALILAREPIGQLLYPAYQAIHPHLPQSAPRLIRAHRHVVAAIAAGNAADAETWMRKHIEDFRRGWLAAGLDEDAPAAGTAAG